MCKEHRTPPGFRDELQPGREAAGGVFVGKVFELVTAQVVCPHQKHVALLQEQPGTEKRGSVI